MQQTFRILRLVTQLGLLVLVIISTLNYQFFLDQYALATFKPAAEVASIEGRLQLTDKARALLYRAKPQLDNKQAFNTDCQTSSGELELGCFYRGRIYVLVIENQSLAPEMDVVMAHELLHAAWVRLRQEERERLGAELQATYEAINDSELRQRMTNYARTEPGEEINELHSILGTEYAGLPSSLEQYYGQYFNNRSMVLQAHAAYQSVFDSRRAELERELATIRALKGQLATINRQLDGYRAAGRIEEYNALVPRQNNLVDTINRRIDLYHKGVEEYNALSRSLDSQEITETESSVQ